MLAIVIDHLSHFHILILNEIQTFKNQYSDFYDFWYPSVLRKMGYNEEVEQALQKLGHI